MTAKRIFFAPRGDQMRQIARASRPWLVALALGLATTLSACGTKGGLDCPPGTSEHIDGTCRPTS